MEGEVRMGGQATDRFVNRVQEGHANVERIMYSLLWNLRGVRKEGILNFQRYRAYERAVEGSNTLDKQPGGFDTHLLTSATFGPA